MIDLIISHWKEIISVLSFIGVGKLFVDSRIKKANIKKEEAVADQESIKVKQADIDLTASIQDVYKTMVTDFQKKLIEQGEAISDLNQKYGEILLRNGILEERAEAREKQYATLEREYTKLKADYKKLHEENKEIREENREIRKELEEIKKIT